MLTEKIIRWLPIEEALADVVGFPKHRAWTDPDCYAEGTSVA